GRHGPNEDVECQIIPWHVCRDSLLLVTCPGTTGPAGQGGARTPRDFSVVEPLSFYASLARKSIFEIVTMRLVIVLLLLLLLDAPSSLAQSFEPLNCLGCIDHGRQKTFQRGGGIIAPAGVNWRSLNDCAAWRDEPVETLALR